MSAPAGSGASNVQQPASQAACGEPSSSTTGCSSLPARLSRTDLQRVLPAHIFRALDLSRSLPIKEKYTYVKMHERLGRSAMRDDVLCPEFGHHASLHLYLGDEFDPSLRGRVLACAARWAAPASDNDALAAGNRFLYAEHRQTWLAAEALWGLKTEIGDSVLTSLFKIVQRIFSDRASKATATVPTCSEVVLACQAQSAAIAEYRAAIADHLLRRSQSEPPGSAAAFINCSWLSFLLPIFYRWMRSDTNHWSQRSSVVVLRQSHQLRHHLQPCSTSRGGRAKLTPLASWAARRVPRSLPPTSPPPGGAGPTAVPHVPRRTPARVL